MNNSKLHKECTVFCRYLIKQEPNDYVQEKYKDAHMKSGIKLGNSSAFDRLLISTSLINPVFTKIVDIYTSIFFKSSVFRKKMILLLAILESCTPSCQYLDSVSTSSKTVLFIRIFQYVSFFVLGLIFSMIFLLPLHLILKAVSR